MVKYTAVLCLQNLELHQCNMFQYQGLDWQLKILNFLREELDLQMNAEFPGTVNLVVWAYIKNEAQRFKILVASCA